MAEKLKIAFSLLLVALGVAGFYLLAGQPTVLRILAIGGGVVVGMVFFLRATELGRKQWEFCQESWVELGKVVWPSKKETMQMTGVVFAFVVVMALFLFIADKTLEWVVYDLILGWRS